MNNTEAKFILQGYRPNGADAGDTTFCAAVEQAKTDPALGEWFAKQQAFDTTISAKLAQVAVPADLRAAILAGGRVTAASSSQQSWWNQPVWMGLAASVAVLLAAVFSLWPKQAMALNEFALADSKLGVMHGHGDHGEPANALQAALSQPGTKLGSINVNFAALRDTGCRTISCQGREVVELCFNRDGVWFHCYIAKASDFPRLAVNTAPTIVDEGGAAIATWVSADNLIMIVSKSGRNALQALL